MLFGCCDQKSLSNVTLKASLDVPLEHAENDIVWERDHEYLEYLCLPLFVDVTTLHSLRDVHTP